MKWQPGQLRHLNDVLAGRKPSDPNYGRLSPAQLAAEAKRLRKAQKSQNKS